MNSSLRIQETMLLADLAGLSEEAKKQLLIANCFSPRLAEKLNTMVMHRAAPRLCAENPFMPVPAEISQGEVYMGEVLDDAIPFCLTLEEAGEHCLISGRSRAGKTNLMYWMISSLVAHGVNILVCDLKQDYRHLLRIIPDLWVMRVGTKDFLYNPLEVPSGVDPSRAAQTTADVLSHAFGLLTGSKGYVYQIIDDLYHSFGVYEGKDTFPTLQDMKEYLIFKRPRSSYFPSAHYWDRVSHRVEMICRAMGESIDCSKGFALEKILSHNVVLEMEGLIPEVQNWFVESLWTKIFLYQMCNNRRGKIRHCLVFDEGNRIFDARAEKSIEEKVPIISDLINKIGEFQVGLLVASQVPSLLNKSIRANTYAKVMMKLNDEEDMRMMANTIGLSPEQVAFCHERLEKGLAVVKLSGRWMYPFTIRIPLFPMAKDVTDDEVQTHMKPVLESLSFAPRTDILKRLMEQKREEREKKASRHIQFLKNVYLHPWLTVTEHYASLGLGSKTGTKVKADLLRWKWVEEIPIATGRRGKQPIILSLTDIGLEKLRESGIQARRRGKGGAKSLWWAHKLAEIYEEKGYQTKIEGFAEGKATVDLELIDPEGRRIAIEIQMSTDHAMENIIKCLKAGYDEVIIASEEDTILRGIEEKAESCLGSEARARVKYKLLKEVLNG